MGFRRDSKRKIIDEDRESFTSIPKRPKFSFSSSFTPPCADPPPSCDEEEEHDLSSVGSNQIADEIISISDDEAESSPPICEKSIQIEFSPSPGLQIEKSEGKSSKNAVIEEEEEEEEGREKLWCWMGGFMENRTEEERMFWENFKSAIIDNNGRLLGEFSRIDEDLIIR